MCCMLSAQSFPGSCVMKQTMRLPPFSQSWSGCRQCCEDDPIMIWSELQHGLFSSVETRALLVGACVSPTLAGPAGQDTAELRVHSVYPRAVNLVRPDSPRLLVSLILDPADMAPNAILLDRPAGRVRWSGDWAAVAAAGDRCRFADFRLQLTGRVTVLLDGADRWEGRLSEAVRYEVTPQRVRALGDLLRYSGRSGGLLGVVCPSADGPVSRFARRRLCAADVEARRKGGAAVDLSSLAGLGPGLTPSGDDFIAGALLGRQLLQLAAPQADVGRAIDAESVRRRLHATTAAGATLLTAAFAGRFPAYLLELCRQFFAAGTAPGGEFPDRLPAHGATSATDAVAGLLWQLTGG